MIYILAVTYEDGEVERLQFELELGEGDALASLELLCQDLDESVGDSHPGRERAVRSMEVTCYTRREAEGGGA